MSTIPIAYTVSPTLGTKITETPLLTKAKIDKTWVPMVPGARIPININWGLLDYPDPATVGFDDEPTVDPRVNISWCFAKGVGIGEGLKGWRPPARVRDKIDEEAGGQRMSIQDLVPGPQRVREMKREEAVKRREEEVKRKEEELERRGEELKKEVDEMRGEVERLLISDASSPDGQRIGAILRAMRVPKQVREVKVGPRTGLAMEVGEGTRDRNQP